MVNQFYNDDCFNIFPQIKDNSVDMILADLPYGTTACKWDTILPLNKLWEQYNRIAKENAAIVLTASQPFTTILVASNIKNFRCEWIWQKNKGSNFANAKYHPLKEHESVLVFSKKVTNYYPIKEKRTASGLNRISYVIKDSRINPITNLKKNVKQQTELRYPSSIQKFNCEHGLHPTQKPVALFEYLIKTYTNENEIVLDNTAGSGTTAIACINTNRKYICIEKDKEYYDKAVNRINNHVVLPI